MSPIINPNTVLLITMLASFSTPFMLSSINIAMPDMARDLNINAVGLVWVSLSFLISSSVLLLPMGKLADIYGRKKVFMTGFIIFTLASFLCAASPTASWLIFFRFLQGAGSSMIFGTGIAILTSVFPSNQRGRVIGMNTGSVYFGLTMGPFLGGMLVEGIGWRSIFYLNFLLGIGVLFLIFTKLKEEWKGTEEERFDLKGSVIYAGSMAFLMLGLSAITSSLAQLAALAGLAGLIWFLYYESKISCPVININLMMKNTVFTFSNIAAFINYSATFSIGFLLSLYLQYIKDMSPQKAGLMLLWMPAVMGIFSPLAGRISDKKDPRIVASAGMAVATTGLLFFIPISENYPVSLIIAGLCVIGLGLALFSSPNTNAVMGSVEHKYYSVAAATVSTMRVFGQMLSMATVMLIFSLFIGKTKIAPENFHELILSFRTAMWIFSGLSFIGIFVSLKRGQGSKIPHSREPLEKQLHP